MRAANEDPERILKTHMRVRVRTGFLTIVLFDYAPAWVSFYGILPGEMM